MLNVFLGSFLNDWWDAIRKFFNDMNSIVKILIISALILLSLLFFIRCFKPSYSADKNKSKALPLIGGILFMALACLIIFI